MTDQHGIDQLTRDIVNAVATTNVDTANDRQALDDLGIDSLDRLTLAVLIEERTGRAIPDEHLATTNTVADVKRLIAGPRTPARS